MQYQEAVQEARGLVKRSEDDQWRLAQLTYEQTTGTGKSRHQWAKDIGVDPEHVYRLYRVWERHGSDQVGIRPRFADAYAEARAGVASTQTTAEQVQREATRHIRNMPPAQRAEVVREALADPVVAEVAMRDDETSVNVAAARAKHVQQRNERQDEAARIRAPQAYQDGDVLAAQNSLGHVIEYLELAIKQIGQVPEHRRAEFFPRLVGEVDRLTSWLHSVVDGQSLDAGLAKLLEGGEGR